METKRPIQRRDFLKSATAASMLAGTATLAARADEPPKEAGEKPKEQGQAGAGGRMVGMEAVDCLAELVRGMESVRSIYVFEAPVHPKPAMRTIESKHYYDVNPKRPLAMTADEQKVVAEALQIRATSRVPFWDAVLIDCHNQEKVPRGLLDAALYHAGAAASGKGQFMTREQLLAGEVKQMCQKKGDAKWIAMTSEVILTDGSPAHIPLLNFRCSISPLNRNLVSEVAKRVFPGGAVILEAGKSYQAYGRSTIPPKSFAPLLGKALLFGNVVNHRYVAHQLIDGRCTVGLSAAGARKSPPVCVAIV
jgi:hypothetical protein